MNMGTELRMKLHSELYNEENIENLKNIILAGIDAVCIDITDTEAQVDQSSMRILINKTARSKLLPFESIRNIINLSFAKFLNDNGVQLTCPIELLCNVTSVNDQYIIGL